MVVTRKSSVTPMPSTRSKSSQPSSPVNNEEVPSINGIVEPTTPAKPRPDHTGPQFSDNVVFSDSPSSKKGNLSSPKSSPKHKSKSKGKRKEERLRSSSTSFVDLVARVFLLFFLLYSLAVCPSEKEQLQSPVCRALSEYRRLVLEPVVIRPFQNLITHPSVSPYVDYVTPHIRSVTDTISPAVTLSKQEWDSRVVPLWNDRVVPHLDKYLSPQLVKVQSAVKPYSERVSASYERYVGPYVTHAQHFSDRARPYLLLTAAKTYDTYQSMKPHVQSATNGLKRVPPLFFKYIATPLGSARGQFVDPHVATIIEKIKELSSGKPRSASKSSGEDEASILDEEHSSVTPDPVPAEHTDADALASDDDRQVDGNPEIELPLVPEPTEEAKTPATSVISASAYSGDELSESVPGATYSPEATAEADIVPPPEPEAELEAEITSEPLGTLVTEFVHLVETQFVLETIVETEVVVEVETAPAISEVVVTSEVIVEVAEPTAVTTESSNNIVEESIRDESPSSISPTSTAFDDFDPELESFYADLGISDDDFEKLDGAPQKSQIEEAPVRTRVEMSPEERAESERKKQEEIAEKRRKISARHAKWENDIEDKVKEQRKALRKTLVASRKAAVEDLKHSDAIREEIEKLNNESEKALRGTEAYFKKLAKEGRSKEESVRVWDRVLEKVADKYSERVHSVENVVMQWYERIHSEEIAEVQRAANAVKDVGERGQADLGLDYAWLDDVTVQDWNRYHSLLDKYTEFFDHAMTIQNGTHPSPPINPVLTALSDLQAEVNDITLGFETRLRRIQRQGDRAFASNKARDVEKLDVEDTDNVKETGESAEPVVSVLPVPDQESFEAEEILGEVSDAILGRGKEEMDSADSRASRHEEL